MTEPITPPPLDEAARHHPEEARAQENGATADSDLAAEAESAARERQQRLPRVVRHDMRSCLNQIIGYSDLLTDEATERNLDDFVADLQKIHTAGRNLLDFINTYVDPVNTRADNYQPRPVSAPSADSPATPNKVSEDSSEAQRAQAPQSKPQTDSVAAEEAEPNAEPKEGCILVVDDSEANREMLLRLLHKQGYEADEAQNGREALEMVAARAYDLVLLDVLLPEADGYEVLAQMKAEPAAKDIPVIMVSALDDMDSVARGITLGAEDYLPKPFDPVLLKARIEASLEKKRLRDREKALFAQVESSYHQLQESERMRDDLTHMIVHDLRTPLTSLISGLQTLELIEPLTGDQQELVTMAEIGGNTLLGMINDMLDISKSEDGSLKLDVQTLEAAALVKVSLEQVAALAQEKTLNLVPNVPHSLPTLIADEEKMRRTLVNLLGNAIKFTPVKGTITLAVTYDDDSMTFSVADTGEGIPREAFDRIFDKFGQVQTRKAGRKMSTGLGLTFCKMVAEAHGGRIWVESELGQGSTFFVRIPRQPAENAVSESQ